jgi:hypothetical protein
MHSPDAHDAPQLAQFCGSCLRSTQRPLQQRPVVTIDVPLPTPRPNAQVSPVAPGAHASGRHRLPSQ